MTTEFLHTNISAHEHIRTDHITHSHKLTNCGSLVSLGIPTDLATRQTSQLAEIKLFMMGLFSRKTTDKSFRADRAIFKGLADGEIDPWTLLSISTGKALLLTRECTKQIKSRGLAIPLLFLPFRPESNSPAVRTFIRSYFAGSMEGNLERHFAITEPLVLVGVLRWTYFRISGGLLTLQQYQLYARAERELSYAPCVFSLVVDALFDCEDKRLMFYDFVELLASVAANNQTNGHSGEKLARITCCFIFHDNLQECADFRVGYDKWKVKSEANAHLFFAYVRELLYNSNSGFSGIPLVLEKMIKNEAYPPITSTRSNASALKMRIAIHSYSRSPLALMRRVLQFSPRVENDALSSLAQDPIDTKLTSECSRVMQCIEEMSAAHTQRVAMDGLATDWLDFEDFGFGASDESRYTSVSATTMSRRRAASRTRPKTRDWCQFSDTGFHFGDQSRQAEASMLPIDLRLPSIIDRQLESHDSLRSDTGVLSEVQTIKIDESFWEAWIISMSRESPQTVKQMFGKCVIVQTNTESHWFVFEEIMTSMSRDCVSHTIGLSKRHDNFLRNLVKYKTRVKSRSLRDKLQSEITMDNPGVQDIQAAEQRVRVLISKRQAARRPNMTPVRKEPLAAHKTTTSIYALNIGSELNTILKWTQDYDQDSVDHDPCRSGSVRDHLSPEKEETLDPSPLQAKISTSDPLKSERDEPPIIFEAKNAGSPEEMSKQQKGTKKNSLMRRFKVFERSRISRDRAQNHATPYATDGSNIYNIAPPRQSTSSHPESMDRFHAAEPIQCPEDNVYQATRPVDMEPELPELSAASVTGDGSVYAHHRVLPWNTTPGSSHLEQDTFLDQYTRPWVQIHSNAAGFESLPSKDVRRPLSLTASSPPSSNASTEFMLANKEFSSPGTALLGGGVDRRPISHVDIPRRLSRSSDEHRDNVELANGASIVHKSVGRDPPPIPADLRHHWSHLLSAATEKSMRNAVPDSHEEVRTVDNNDQHSTCCDARDDITRIRERVLELTTSIT